MTVGTWRPVTPAEPRPWRRGDRFVARVLLLMTAVFATVQILAGEMIPPPGHRRSPAPCSALSSHGGTSTTTMRTDSWQRSGRHRPRHGSASPAPAERGAGAVRRVGSRPRAGRLCRGGASRRRGADPAPVQRRRRLPSRAPRSPLGAPTECPGGRPTRGSRRRPPALVRRPAVMTMEFLAAADVPS